MEMDTNNDAILPNSSLDEILTTNLYRQNVSKVLIVCEASLARQTIINANPSHQQQQQQQHYPFSWMGDAARSLALRSATSPFFASDNHHDTDSRKNGKNKLNKNHVHKSNRLDVDITAAAAIRTTTTPTTGMLSRSPTNSWSDCFCMACGTLLLPPPEIDHGVSNASIVDETPSSTTTMSPQLLPVHSHISLRPLKRGKTRRRRASRVKAKELHNRTLSLQRRRGGGGNNNNNSNIQMIQKEILQKEKIQRMASMYNLGDGRAKNCIVIQCTFCGTKKKRKGMEIQKSNPPPPQSSSPKMGVVHAKNNSDSRKNKMERRLVVKPTSEKADVSSQIRDNTDFISLDSERMSSGIAVVGMGRDARTRKQGGDVDGQNGIVSPLLLLGKNKKKKKRPETTKTSALMDFLSSLND